MAATSNKKSAAGRSRGQGANPPKKSANAGGNPGKTGGRKENGSKKAGGVQGRKNTAVPMEEPEDFFGAEALILVCFAVAVLLFLSNFHLCGVAGDYLRSIQLGIFGSVGFIAPFLLFVGTCFYLSNQGNMTAMRKLLASVATVVILCGFAQLLFGKQPEDQTGIFEFYRLSSESGAGGGLVGGILYVGLTSIVGNIGAFLVLLAGLAISVVCITERSLVKAVKRQSDAAYRYAKEDMSRRKEERAERQEERRQQKEQRIRGVNLESTTLGDLEAAEGYYGEPAAYNEGVGYGEEMGYEGQPEYYENTDYGPESSYGEPGYGQKTAYPEGGYEPEGMYSESGSYGPQSVNPENDSHGPKSTNPERAGYGLESLSPKGASYGPSSKFTYEKSKSYKEDSGTNPRLGRDRQNGRSMNVASEPNENIPNENIPEERTKKSSPDPADVFVGKITPAAYHGEDMAPFAEDKVLSPAESAQRLVAEGITRLSDLDGSFGRPVEPPPFHTPASEPSFHGLASAFQKGEEKELQDSETVRLEPEDLPPGDAWNRISVPEFVQPDFDRDAPKPEQPFPPVVRYRAEDFSMEEEEILLTGEEEPPIVRYRGNYEDSSAGKSEEEERKLSLLRYKEEDGASASAQYQEKKENKKLSLLRYQEENENGESSLPQYPEENENGAPSLLRYSEGNENGAPSLLRYQEENENGVSSLSENKEETGNGRSLLLRYKGQEEDASFRGYKEDGRASLLRYPKEDERDAAARYREENKVPPVLRYRADDPEEIYIGVSTEDSRITSSGYMENDLEETEGFYNPKEGFVVSERDRRVVTASGKVIDSDTEALHKKLESRRQEVREDQQAGEISMQQQIQQKELQPKKEYIFPPVTLLKRGNLLASANSEQEYKDTAIKLQQTLRDFGVGVTVTNISCGPSVTRYELHPEQGVKVSKIVSLADDIKLSLAAEDIRIEAPIPGKSAVGIEVPNKETTMVYLRELLESEAFQKHSSPMAFAVGKDIGGQVVVTDIAKMPHLLIAGATGSGKSVCINTLIMSILFKASPEHVKLIMVDPKVVELSVYNGIPHLLIPVVTDPKKASGALNWAVAEMQDRYKKFAECNVRNLAGYNARIDSLGEEVPDEEKPKRMPQIIIIVDELADLMMVAPGEVEDAICRLAQLARAAGIHLVIATQRPSVNVITGLIKANVPSRIAFSVSSGVDSRTIIDMYGAEKLLGKGDMLFFPSGIPKPQRVQGAFVSDSEVQKVVEFLTEQGMSADYDPDVERQMSSASSMTGGGGAGGNSGRDEYFEQAGRFIIEKDKASIGMLQRMFKIGFNRAARIMDQLADAGIVGEEEGTKPRKILVTMEEFEELLEE